MMMGKLLPQRFTTDTGLARGPATLIARQVLANDEASEPTRIRKTRVLLVVVVVVVYFFEKDYPIAKR